MTGNDMLTTIDGPTLAAAFPAADSNTAIEAGRAVAILLAPRQWTERLVFQVRGQTVLIPARLHFESDQFDLPEHGNARSFALALQTRSNNGFERQRAIRDLLPSLQPWGAPFVVLLIGEWVVEILEDIFAALTPENYDTLGVFIIQNRDFWQTTKSRATSYWNAYYRYDCGSTRAFSRSEYVGFKLVDRLESAALKVARALVR